MLSEARFKEIISQFEKINPVLVVGDIGVDKYTKGEVKRISPEAPVPIVEVFEEWNKLGLAANVSDNLQSLGVKSTICGVIGDDLNGNILENLLEEHKLSTWGVVRCKERMTTFKERVVTDVQQICRVDYETKDNLKKETLERVVNRISEFIEGHSAVILEDYGKGLFCDSFSEKIINLSKKYNKFIAVDPSRTTNPLLYKGVNLLKPNKLESELIVKSLGYTETNTQTISDILIDKLSIEKLIITLGSEGMAITDVNVNGGKMKTIPTVAREVFDVSGAGDTAISTIVASIAAGATLEEAAWIGNCASGVVIGKQGTALVNQEELKDFYSELGLLKNQ
ncbi:MAG: rfaE bifunctional protein kinase chain/domain [Bacteriovoracaceae bacterium]|jgi:rfaE bifunctional protein kinase chain/domain